MNYNITLPKQEQWQRDLLQTYITHQKDTIISVKSPRQVGKSIAIEILLIYVALTKNRSVSIEVSPIISQCRKIYTDIVNMLDGIPVIKKKNDTLLQIEFKNGSTIYFKSAEQRDGLRGFTVSGILVVDEASFISSNIFYELLLPFTNVHHTSIVLTSTPKFKQGFYYESYMHGLNGVSGYISLDWNNYNLSKFLSPEKLLLYRNTLPLRVFQSEYLGEFIDGQSTVFGEFSKCIRENVQIHGNTYFGIDLATGTGSDSTCITIGSFEGNRVYVKEQISFNDKNTQQTISAIMEQVEKYHPKGIVLELNSIGHQFRDLLAAAVDEYVQEWNETHNWKEQIDIAVNAVTTTNKNKQEFVDKLSLMFEQDKIEIPDNKDLITQLSMYTCTLNKNGIATYNAPSGMHDDSVLSLAMFLHNSPMKRYAVV